MCAQVSCDMVLCTDLELVYCVEASLRAIANLAMGTLPYALFGYDFSAAFKPVNVRMNQSHSSTLSFLICCCCLSYLTRLQTAMIRETSLAQLGDFRFLSWVSHDPPAPLCQICSCSRSHAKGCCIPLTRPFHIRPPPVCSIWLCAAFASLMQG